MSLSQSPKTIILRISSNRLKPNGYGGPHSLQLRKDEKVQFESKGPTILKPTKNDMRPIQTIRHSRLDT